MNKKDKKEGVVCGFMQRGQMIECGNCHPEKYEDCKQITKKYPHIICDCICHSNKMKMTIRDLIKENREIQLLHDKWSMENDRILEEKKDVWNFGIIVRNHTRDFIDELLRLLNK